MKQTLVYISTCAADRNGTPGSFLLQELPWLRNRFGRVLVCGPQGIAEITEDKPARLTAEKPAFGAVRACVRALFSMQMWAEMSHLRKDKKLSLRSALKLYLFTARGYKLYYWIQAKLHKEEQTAFYSYWMSYDGFAAALCKRKSPQSRAIARGHAFDIDVSRNPMNPYLMKLFIAQTLDSLYPISETARTQIESYVQIAPEKVQVVGVGSAGGPAEKHFPAPRFQDGVFRVVSCSAMVPIKQLPLMIDTLAAWTAGKLHWVHIGGGAEEAAIRAYTEKQLGNHPLVTYELKGYLPPEQLQTLYATEAFDVFLNTSKMEGTPVSIMEALHEGIPVVAPAVAGIAELVDESVGCLYAQGGKAEDVLHALETVYAKTTEEAKQMSTLAQARWNERCQIGTLLPKLFEKPQATGKRILLVSHCFAPQNKIGAVRPTKLTKYLQRLGYRVTVFCGKDVSPVRDPLLARDLESIPDIHVVTERSLLRWWKERKPASSGSTPQTAAKPAKAKPWLNAVYLVLADRADAAFARACIRKVKQMGERYDIVLSSYGPRSVHTIAASVKRKGYAKQWIADFRDETTMPFAWQKRRLKQYNTIVMNHADHITSVSAGYLRVMGMEAHGQVIFNGFDPEDSAGIPSIPKRADKLTFIHCGQMYGAQRDLSPFFHALAELIAEGEIGRESVALVYAGRDTSGFVAQATGAGLQDCLEGHGFIPRDESLRLQTAAHVLLLPAWNLPNRQGNIPGKLLEYMLLAQPVVCCVSGTVPNSEIAGILRETNIGVCFEQANAKTDTPRLKAYLTKIVWAYQSGEPLPYEPNREAIGRFTSEGMAASMANIIEEMDVIA